MNPLKRSFRQFLRLSSQFLFSTNVFNLLFCCCNTKTGVQHRFYTPTKRLHKPAAAVVEQQEEKNPSPQQSYFEFEDESDLIDVYVDGHGVRVPSGVTVLQACEAVC